MAQALNRNELIQTLVTMREQEVASFKSFLETADLNLLATLVQQPPSEEDIGAYKYYIYNNPWHNQLILKSKHWREWIDRNPIYSNLFSEIKTTSEAGKPISILPTGINLSTTTWDPASGTPPPPNVDWKSIFTSFKLEVDRLNERIKILNLEREQGSKSIDFLMKQSKQNSDDQHKLLNQALENEKTAREAYNKLQKTLAENSTNLSSVEKQQNAQLIKDLGTATTDLIQVRASTSAQISLLTTEVSNRDQTILGLRGDIQLLKTQTGNKEKDLVNMENHYKSFIANMKSTHELEVKTLKADGRELQNKLIKLEENVDAWTTDTMAKGGNDGLETVEEMKIALAGLQPWFNNAGLVKTWQFAKDAYDELMTIQSKLYPDTINPADEATIKKKLEWKKIQGYFLTVLANADSKINSDDVINKSHNHIIVDDLKNDSNSTLTRLGNVRGYLLEHWPDFLRNHEILGVLHQWEAFENLSSRTSIPLEKPESKPASVVGSVIPSGASTPGVLFKTPGSTNVWSVSHSHAISSVPSPRPLNPKPLVTEELQKKKNELEELITSKLLYYSAFSAIDKNTIPPAKFKKYPSLSKLLSAKDATNVRWESYLDAINKDKSWEVLKEEDRIGYDAVEFDLRKALTEVIIERLIEMNNVGELIKYKGENVNDFDLEVYRENKSKINAFILKETVLQIQLIMDKITDTIPSDSPEREHYRQMNSELANESIDYETLLMNFRTFVRQKDYLLADSKLLEKLNYWETIEEVPLTKADAYDWKTNLDDICRYLQNSPDATIQDMKKWGDEKLVEVGNPMDGIDLDNLPIINSHSLLKDDAIEKEIKKITSGKFALITRWKDYTPLQTAKDNNGYLNALAVMLIGRQDNDPTAKQLNSIQNIATRLRVAVCLKLMTDKVWLSLYATKIDKLRNTIFDFGNKEGEIGNGIGHEESIKLLAMLLQRPITLVAKDDLTSGSRWGGISTIEAGFASGLPTFKYDEPFVIYFDGVDVFVPLIQQFVHREGIFKFKVTGVEQQDNQRAFVFEFEKPLQMINFSLSQSIGFSNSGIAEKNKVRIICGGDDYGKERYNKIKTELNNVTDGLFFVDIVDIQLGDNLKVVEKEIIISPSAFNWIRIAPTKTAVASSLKDLMAKWYPDRTVKKITMDDEFFAKAGFFSDEVLDFSPYRNLEEVEYALDSSLVEELKKQLDTQTKLDERKWDDSWETEDGVKGYLDQLNENINTFAKRGKVAAIEQIKVSDNEKLKTLVLPFARLKSLDLSKNIDLKKLDVSYNKLKSLDLSKNTNLEEVNVSHNKIDMYSGSGVRTWDLSMLTKIRTLNVAYNKLGGLKIWRQPELIGDDLKTLFGTKFNALGRLAQIDEKKYENARRHLCPQLDDNLEIVTSEVDFPSKVTF